MSRFGMALAFFSWFAGSVIAQETPATPDAALRAMHMANAKEGWAVGDDGIILHTLDGWESCEQQRTNVRVSLRAVHFVDAFVGYAVGSEALPYGRGTGGVVLATTDGGSSWKKLIHRELPGLCGVKFLDARVGYAFGDTTGGNTGGIFFTDNGGRTWKSCSALDTHSGWLSGTIINDNPVAVGAGGMVGLMEKDQVLPIAIKGCERINWMSVACCDQDVWGVGTQAGVILSRQTGGKSFEPVTMPIPDAVRRQLDFNSVCAVGNHVWIVGRPGTFVYHSPDRGKTWEMQRSTQSLPLHQVNFVSESVGYCVGELGTILKTSDSGATWSVVRRGGHRSAVLFVTANGQQMPLGSIAYIGGDQGYLCVGLQACVEPGKWHTDREKLQHAVRVVGGTTTDVLTRMPVADYQQHMSAGMIVKLAEEQRLLEQLVLAIRMWRPSVVIGDSAEPGMPSGPMGAAVSLVVRQACDLAGSADVFPEQIRELHLEPWQPERQFARRLNKGNVDCALKLNVPRPVLFASPNDFAGLGRPILFDNYQRGPVSEEYTLIKNYNGTYTSQHPLMAMFRNVGMLGCFIPPALMPNDDLFVGITLGHGGQARREKVEVEDLKYQLLLGATYRQQMDAKPYQQKLFDPGERRQFFTNFEYTLNGLAPMTIGDRIAAQAQEFVEKGQWTMARECHLMLLDLMPTHRLAPESARFISTMMGSSEIKRRVDLKTMPHLADYVLRSPSSKGGDTTELPFQALNPKQRTILQKHRLELRRWNGGALAAGSLYSVLHPLGYNEPEMQFCLMANERMDGRTEEDQLRQTAFLYKEPGGVWNQAVQAEQWLTQRIGDCPKPLMQAVRVKEMPQLDGKVDDAVWKNVPVTTLKSAVGKMAGTKVQMAFDDTHLYLAVQCQQAPGMPTLKPVKPRKRDDDLRSYDRISLLLDLDRDYGTAFHLEFDARGCVMEECCGDITWNPKWFVEVCPNETGWSAEVAIPLVEITGSGKLENDVWAASVTRIIPGVGLEASSLPAGVKPVTRGMGLLFFGETVMQAQQK